MKEKIDMLTLLLPMSKRKQELLQKKPTNIRYKLSKTILMNIMDYQTPAICPTDFADKVLILSFRARRMGCGLVAFPKLDFLQNISDEQVRILAIADRQTDYLNAILGDHKDLSTIPLPLFKSNSTLKELFEKLIVPNAVWMTPEGKIKKVVKGYYLTKSNMRHVLNYRNFIPK